MNFDDSKTMIDDLADETEEPAKKEEFDFDSIKTDEDKKKEDEDYSMDTMFGSLDDDDTPPTDPKKEKISTDNLLYIVWGAVVVIVGLFAYLLFFK